MTTPRSKAEDVLALQLAAVQAANEQTAATAALAAATNPADRARAARRLDRIAPRVVELAQDLTTAKKKDKN